MSLTQAQRESITSWQRGDVCVVAGPGSGKTRVLVERVRWLVAEKRVDAGEILAITFTKKAAASMKSRLVTAAGADKALRRDLERAWISTIDAFCARFLRENAIAARVDPDFEILEPSDADLELHAAIDETLNFAFEQDPEAALRFLLAFSGTEKIADSNRLTKIHDEASAGCADAFRGMGRDPFERPESDHPRPLERQWALAVAKKAAWAYEDRKRSLGRLDFPDLTIRTIDLLRSGAALPGRFRHILIDENQDTNPLQEELVRSLQQAQREELPTLFAVGDLNQSIYAFRDAKPEVFRQYRRRVETTGGHPVQLLENFRSRPEILAAAEALTQQAPGVEARELAPQRGFAPKQAPSLEVLLTRSADPRQRDLLEARWIAHRIVELRRTLRISERPDDADGLIRERDARWGDFAILTRTNPRLDSFAEALRDAGVPYELSAGRSFFEAEEVRDLLGFLRLLDNPRDEIRLAAALRSPLGGVDETALARLRNQRSNLVEALRRPKDHPADELERLERFRDLLERYRSEREDVRPDVLLARIVAETGYETWLLSQSGGAHRAANLAKLAALVANADDGRSSYKQILDRMEQRQSLGTGEAEAGAPEDSADAVHLMTLHSAKGLEFPVVAMAAIQAGTENRSPSFLVDPEHGLGGRWLDANGKGIEDAAYSKAHTARKTANAEEEDRLFYVGMTRAEEHLILSAAFGDKKPQKRNGAKRLAGFGIDIAAIDETPCELELHGCRLRVFRTDQEPPSTAVEPLETERTQVELIEPLPQAGQADAAAAVTAVSLFADCPRKYYLSRYLGLDDSASAATDGTPTDGDLSASELGRSVHEILAGMTEPGEGEAAELAEVFRQSALGRRADAAESRSRERRLLFPIGERLLRGVVDLVFSDEDGRVLVDYKTDRVKAAEIPDRSEPYALQLQLYAVALERAGEKPDRAVLHFLRPDELVEVDLSPGALEAAQQRVEELFVAQEAQQFELRPAPRCRRCPHYRGQCPAQLLPTTKDDSDANKAAEPNPAPPGTQYSLF